MSPPLAEGIETYRVEHSLMESEVVRLAVLRLIKQPEAPTTKELRSVRASTFMEASLS